MFLLHYNSGYTLQTLAVEMWLSHCLFSALAVLLYYNASKIISQPLLPAPLLLWGVQTKERLFAAQKTPPLATSLARK